MGYSTHISLSSHLDVANLCLPLKSILNYNYFEFIRLFPDGSRLSLSPYPEVIEGFYFNSEIFKQVYCLDHYPEGESVSVLKQDILGFSVEERLKYESHFKANLDAFDIDNMVFIINKSEQYSDLFGYAGFVGDDAFMPSFFSHLDLLRRFQLYFVSEARGLIEMAGDQKVIQAWRFPKIKQIDNAMREAFINNTALKKLYLPEVDCYLTRAELKVVEHVANGLLNSKLIGQKCYLSSRTVESHLANIKSKLDCRYNHELVLKIKELRLSDYFC